ncbi:MAG: TRAP transporter substrate-binding protein [Piscinibacter sp.]|nr:TRAP transporter substrate-binding protein [Piscinibacter sp.]
MTIGRITALAAAAFVVAGSAAAQDKPVEIKLAHWVPANHLLATTGFIPWGQSIEAASKGSIKVTIFPAQQLGKAPDHYDMARDGIATVAYVNPGYQAGRFPIFAAGELPFLVDKPGPASQALDAWYRQYAEKEMKDVKVCLAHLHVGTIHSKQPITEPGQIKGMKIRPANGTVGAMMTQLGATNVQVSAPEARDALEKGVADAITFPWNSIISFGIDKVTKYHTDMRLYAAVFVWAMNKPFYDGLSPNQKKVIDDHCNNEWAAKVGQAWGDAEDAGKGKLAAMGGHTIVPMSAQQIDAWKKSVAPVYEQWVQNAGKAGIDGKAALDDLKARLQKTGGAY